MAIEIGTDILGTVANGTGASNGSHLIYAVNAARWIVFYVASGTTTKIQAQISSSNDLTTATWSALTASPVLANARATGSDARNFGVGYANISSTDVIHLGIGITGGFDQTIRATVVANDLSWGSWAELNSAATLVAPTGNTIGFSGEASPHVNEASIMLNTAQDAQMRVSTNADSGSAWTAGFNTGVVTDSSMATTCNSYFLCRIDTTGKMAVIYDDGAASTTMSNLRYNKMTSANVWPSTGSAAAIATLTTVNKNDWAAVRISDTVIYALTRGTSASNTWKFSLYNGNATWTAKTAPGAQNQKSASGVHLATDGTDIWAFIIDSDAPNTVRFNKYTVAADTWGGWTAQESTTQTRNLITGFKLSGNNQINVIYTQTNGSNFKLMVTTLTLTTPAAPTFTTFKTLLGVGQI